MALRRSATLFQRGELDAVILCRPMYDSPFPGSMVMEKQLLDSTNGGDVDASQFNP